jgi:hypothetical protein
VFIKVTTSGGRRYAQLVESFRNESGQPRQRTLATLGRLEPGGDVDRLIQSLHRAQGREDAGPSASASVHGLQFLESRSAGDVWALWQLWLSLDLEGLSLAWRGSKCEVDTLGCLRTMVFNRLCDPASKLGVLRWLETVALPKGFGFEAAPPEHHHLLRAMDVLDEHADAIADRLALLMRPLIDQELSVVFYDLTTVRIHGVTSRRNPATRSRHIPASWRGAEVHLEALCLRPYFAAFPGGFWAVFLDAGGTCGSRYDMPSSSRQ